MDATNGDSVMDDVVQRYNSLRDGVASAVRDAREKVAASKKNLRDAEERLSRALEIGRKLGLDESVLSGDTSPSCAQIALPVVTESDPAQWAASRDSDDHDDNFGRVSHVTDTIFAYLSKHGVTPEVKLTRVVYGEYTARSADLARKAINKGIAAGRIARETATTPGESKCVYRLTAAGVSWWQKRCDAGVAHPKVMP